MLGGLKQGLREQGYSDQAIVILEARVARRDRAGARAAAEGFARQGAGVLFVLGSELARLAREASRELPIVFVTPGDPVAAGLVASLPRPGGNTTALTSEYPELSAKRLEFLKEASPGVRRVLILYDPHDASSRQSVEAARQGAARLGIALRERRAESRDDVRRGLEALPEVEALLAIPGGAPSAYHPEMLRAAHAAGRATAFPAPTPATAEALISYGASEVEVARQAARLVGKILRGAKAGDLPVERPMCLELVVNLKTAKGLGVTLAPSVLVRTDRVIQ